MPLLRGIEKRLGLAARLAGCLTDTRNPASTTHTYADDEAADTAASDFVARAADLAGRWRSLTPAERRAVLTALVERIDLLRKTLAIRILPGQLLSILLDENDRRDRIRPNEDNELTTTFTVPAHLKHAGMETKLLIEVRTAVHEDPRIAVCSDF